MKKKPIQPKKKEEKSAFSDLIKQMEKEKKKARIVYFVGITVLVLSLIMFLLFSPFKIPVFSQLGDRILGREEVEVVEVEETEKETEAEEVEEEAEEVEEEVEEVKEEVVAPTPTLKATPTTTPTPAPAPKVYNCTDSEIEEWRAGIEQLKGYKADTEARITAFFFECFDQMTYDYPYETEQWYQDTCWNVVCVDLYSDLCAMPDEFQEGIEEFQGELNWCLSDR